MISAQNVTRRQPYRGLVSLVGMICALGSLIEPTNGAPVTFDFEATVGPPRAGMEPIGLPFSFAPGDKLSGTFSFEPQNVPSGTGSTITLQQMTFQIKIDGFEVQTSRYELKSPDNAVSDENPIPEDRIDLRCSFGGNLACNPQQLPGNENIEWAFFASFVGNGNAMDGAQISSDVTIWRRMLPGSLLVTFSQTAIQKSDGFVATIDSLQVVPEPSIATMLAIFLLILCAFVMFYRRRLSVSP